MRRVALAVLLVTAAPSEAPAAARARDGGTLRLAVLPEVRADRLGRHAGGSGPPEPRRRAAVPAGGRRTGTAGARDPQRSAEGVSVVPRPGARSPSGAPLGAAELARAWARALDRSPVARAVLAPVRDLAAALEQQSRGRGALVLPLAYPWPDLGVEPLSPGADPGFRRGPRRWHRALRGGRDRPGPGGAGFPEGRPAPRRLRAHHAVAPCRPACAGDAGRAGTARRWRRGVRSRAARHLRVSRPRPGPWCAAGAAGRPRVAGAELRRRTGGRHARPSLPALGTPGRGTATGARDAAPGRRSSCTPPTGPRGARWRSGSRSSSGRRCPA